MLRRRLSFSIPQSNQSEPEENKSLGSESRSSETHHNIGSGVDHFMSLTRHPSCMRAKYNNVTAETITIREIFKALHLQPLKTLES